MSDIDEEFAAWLEANVAGIDEFVFLSGGPRCFLGVLDGEGDLLVDIQTGYGGVHEYILDRDDVMRLANALTKWLVDNEP